MWNYRNIIGGLALSASSIAVAANPLNLCVFDIVGANGDIMTIAKDYALAAKQWGVNIQPKVYMQLDPAIADFEKGICNGLIADNFITRPYNKFMATVGAIGVISDYDTAQQVLLALGSTKLAGKMNQQNWDVVGYIPYGLVYLASRDRTIDSLQKLAGKTIGVLEIDPSQRRMAQKVGMKPVFMTFDNAAIKFRNGDMDITPIPLVAYQPFEVGKLLGDKGGIARYPMAFMTMNVVFKNNGKYPIEFPQKSREWFSNNSKRYINIVKRWDATVPNHMIYDVPEIDKASYDKLLSQMRREFIVNGTYDNAMINLIRFLRCKQNPMFVECRR